jgi:hypothetical protein
MISNPATFFINGNDEREFTYEGGTTLYHWSPYDSGLSISHEANIIFFANDLAHARDVLRRLFEFWITCNKMLIDNDRNQAFSSNAAIKSQNRLLDNYKSCIQEMEITLAPTNQIFMVGWACNDTIHV